MAWLKGDWFKTASRVSSVVEEKSRVWAIAQHKANVLDLAENEKEASERQKELGVTDTKFKEYEKLLETMK